MNTLSIHLLVVCLALWLAGPADANGVEYSPELQKRLSAALKAKPADYQPRTRHLCKNQRPCYTNRLILEHSPYLLQHAHNPVNWYAWGEEALRKAKEENRVIFLSIGYAACHWCHVMEEESFDNLEIAEVLNKHFIAIKVDREQRPDIDAFYGSAVMYFQGSMGWPMSVFLTPDGKPFYGGTYYNRGDFRKLLLSISDEWQKQPQQLRAKAAQVTRELQQSSRQRQAAKIDNGLRLAAIKSLYSIADSLNGGFGEGSKFPREPWLYLLLDDSYGKSQNDESLTVLRTALTHMAQGGIYDQLAGGFHRYTTDSYWKLPHFEKMLYNQAMLMDIYLQANIIQPDELFTRVVRETADFVLREMRDPEGGFYASLDADSEGEEGRYYLWYLDEWEKVLGKQDAEFAAEIYDVDRYGETEDDGNVLYIATTLEEYAQQHGLAVEGLGQRLNNIRSKLMVYRNKRKPPARDKKIIMGWNGLMISALTESAFYLNNTKYLNAAKKTADFIWNKMQGNGYFYRINYKQKNSQHALLADYVYYQQALISLYDFTADDVWLERAEKIQGIILKLFKDRKNGAYFNAEKDRDAPLPIRDKSAFDKILLSANGVAAKVMIRLARRTGKARYLDDTDEIFRTFAAQIKEVPSAYSSLLIAFHELEEGEKDLPVYGARGHIRINAYLSKQGTNRYDMLTELKIADNWHINSDQPLDQDLIPTRINIDKNSVWYIEQHQYPRGEMKKLGFSRKPLSLYEGHVKIKSTIIRRQSGLNPQVELQLQACNDRLCLPPEKLKLYPGIIEDLVNKNQ